MVARDRRESGNGKSPLNRYRIFFWGAKNILEPDTGGVLSSNVNAAELYNSKSLTLGHVMFTSIKTNRFLSLPGHTKCPVASGYHIGQRM